MNVRETIQYNEEKLLSPLASLSINTKGREREEEECDLRTSYQRDRDRIIHCKSFRRLKHKTQVFLSPEGDHYRTRLTHTLEVSQIARTIARALKMNEDLTEAISLAHDLGHTPFGHAGERALDIVSEAGFKHYEQSVRMVEKLENNGNGLNLTYEVRDGILCHTKGEQAVTLEGRIVRVSDRIAYINHDIDDAIRAGVLTQEQIPKQAIEVLGMRRTQRINTLVYSIVENTKSDEISMAKDVEEAFDILHEFMYEFVYRNPVAKSEESKVPELVERLYNYFINNPNELPDDMKIILQQEGKHRAVTDYIAGMTDRYATQVFGELFIPKSWKI